MPDVKFVAGTIFVARIHLCAELTPSNSVSSLLSKSNGRFLQSTNVTVAHLASAPYRPVLRFAPSVFSSMLLVPSYSRLGSSSDPLRLLAQL